MNVEVEPRVLPEPASAERSRLRESATWVAAHTVEIVFSLLALGWFVHTLWITADDSFWSDDLRVVQQAGTVAGFLKPYNGALSLVSMMVYRLCAEVGHLSYRPFAVAGALSLVAVPVTFFFTTRQRLGPPLAALLALPLLLFTGVSLRAAGLNHYLALVGGIICAAALNRGRRADWILAGALSVSLAAAGGGLVVALACLVHNSLTRPHRRRWIAVLLPVGLYALWWVMYRPPSAAVVSRSLGEKARPIRDLLLAPYYQVGLGRWILAMLAGVAFLAWGFVRLRHGLRASANFVAWTFAAVAWPAALVQSRSDVSPTTFRYAYLSLGFLLLAVVPDRPIKWPRAPVSGRRRWLAAAAVVLVLLAGIRYVDGDAALANAAELEAYRGRLTEGTMLLAGLNKTALPDGTRLTFFGFTNPHGTARQLRALMDRYGWRRTADPATIDGDLVDLYRTQVRYVGRLHPPCNALAKPMHLAPTSFGESKMGRAVPGFNPATGPVHYGLWSNAAFEIDVRRFGDHWVRLADVKPGSYVLITLPALGSDKPWELRANGACLAS